MGHVTTVLDDDEFSTGQFAREAHALLGGDDAIVVAVPNYFHTVDHKPGEPVWLGVQNASVIDLGAREQ